MTTIQHKDAIGQILARGDIVTFPHGEYQSLLFGRVVRSTPKMIAVIPLGYERLETLKIPEGLLKVGGHAIEEFFASREKIV